VWQVLAQPLRAKKVLGLMLDVFALIILLVLLRIDPARCQGRVAQLNAQFELTSPAARPASLTLPATPSALRIRREAFISIGQNCRAGVLRCRAAWRSRSMPRQEMTSDGRTRPATGGRT